MNGTPYGGLPTGLGVRPAPALVQQLLVGAFGWMFAGLLLTAGVAGLVATNERLMGSLTDLWLFLIIGQLLLVVTIQAGLRRMPASLALGLFFVYAASMGLTVGVIVSLYTGESVMAAFLSASAMFGGAAIYGAVTKRELAGIGGYLTIGLIGLLVALVVNTFLGSSPIGWALSILGVLLFTVLTAYDVQRISRGDYAAFAGSLEKASVLGALSLYLDFVNLFLFLLRLMGGRR